MEAKIRKLPLDELDRHLCAGQTAHFWALRERLATYGHYAFEQRAHGAAIDYILFDDESRVWFAYNNEYATAITFCPWCGSKLPVMAKEDERS